MCWGVWLARGAGCHWQLSSGTLIVSAGCLLSCLCVYCLVLTYPCNNVLLCTAACSHVYNTELPAAATEYLHRAGRSGRIGSSVQGEAAAWPTVLLPGLCVASHLGLKLELSVCIVLCPCLLWLSPALLRAQLCVATLALMSGVKLFATRSLTCCSRMLFRSLAALPRRRGDDASDGGRGAEAAGHGH